MNRMKTALGLECNCCILLGRLAQYCLVWRLMTWLGLQGWGGISSYLNFLGLKSSNWQFEQE